MTKTSEKVPLRRRPRSLRWSPASPLRRPWPGAHRPSLGKRLSRGPRHLGQPGEARMSLCQSPTREPGLRLPALRVCRHARIRLPVRRNRRTRRRPGPHRLKQCTLSQLTSPLNTQNKRPPVLGEALMTWTLRIRSLGPPQREQPRRRSRGSVIGVGREVDGHGYHANRPFKYWGLLAQVFRVRQPVRTESA